jgi:hypothetical protein
VPEVMDEEEIIAFVDFSCAIGDRAKIIELNVIIC